MHGSHLGEDLYMSKKYIIDNHCCIHTHRFHRKENPISIQNIKYVCNILASAGIIVNSEREPPLIEMCLI